MEWIDINDNHPKWYEWVFVYSPGVANRDSWNKRTPKTGPIEYDDWIAAPCAYYDRCQVKNKNMHCYKNKPCFVE